MLRQAITVVDVFWLENDEQSTVLNFITNTVRSLERKGEVLLFFLDSGRGFNF